VGHGVHAFIYSPDTGDYYLHKENIKIPPGGSYYSVNEAYYNKWKEPVQKYVTYLKEKKKKSLRYVGSFVSDFHRNLLHGGIFLYPADTKNPEGKLRLIYEIIPLTCLVEEAGGLATTGSERINKIIPSSIHQRCPVIVRSKKDVEKAEKFFKP